MMKTILVVDDEEDIRILYQEEFSDMGYQVFTAQDGQEALERVKDQNPDLVTLDLKMPRMDGVDFLRKVRETHRTLPIVIVSAYGEYKQDFSVWLSDAYITKSADLTELKSKVKELLG